MTKTLNALTKVSINHRDNIFIQKNKLKQFRVLINYSRLSVVSREITHDGFGIEEKTYS